MIRTMWALCHTARSSGLKSFRSKYGRLKYVLRSPKRCTRKRFLCDFDLIGDRADEDLIAVVFRRFSRWTGQTPLFIIQQQRMLRAKYAIARPFSIRGRQIWGLPRSAIDIQESAGGGSASVAFNFPLTLVKPFCILPCGHMRCSWAYEWSD